MPKLRKKLTETHAMIEQDEPTSLEAVWGGVNELSKYGTLDQGEYKTQLLEMNRTDLEAHARKIGLVPIPDTERLIKNLVREFESYAFYLRKPLKVKPAPQKPTKDIQAILGEGR